MFTNGHFIKGTDASNLVVLDQEGAYAQATSKNL
jgi:hypothetical protein